MTDRGKEGEKKTTRDEQIDLSVGVHFSFGSAVNRLLSSSFDF